MTSPGNTEARPGAGSWWMLAVLLSYSVLSLIDRGAINLLVVRRSIGESVSGKEAGGPAGRPPEMEFGREAT